MVNKSTNICFIIEDLLKTNSFSEIGKVFSEGLKRKKRDVIAFETIDINRLRHIQSDTMRKMKSYMIMTNIHNQTPYEIEFKRELNKNSLLGLIKELLNENGNKYYESIGKAVYKGSKKYLKKNPLAENTNFYQFREYRSILSELEKLL